MGAALPVLQTYPVHPEKVVFGAALRICSATVHFFAGFAPGTIIAAQALMRRPWRKRASRRRETKSQRS
jgi:hypothetical protein